MENENKDKQKNAEKQNILTKETLGVVITLFATLCLVCLITREKVFALPGQVINAFFLGIFGWFSYPVLIFAGIYGVMLIFDKHFNLSTKNKLYIIFGVICLAVLCHIINMGETTNYLSYGDYLGQSYTNGSEGISCSSAGGILVGILAYPISALLTVIGGAVLTGIGFIFCVYSLVKIYAKKLTKVKNTVRPNFNSTFVPSDEEKNNISISGERDYPIDGVVLPQEKPLQKLFVSNSEDFAFKTRKDVLKGNNDSLKLEIDKNGMGVAKYGGSYSESYTQDMKKKIEYIKTPAKLDFESSLNHQSVQTGNCTSVSDYLSRGNKKSESNFSSLQINNDSENINKEPIAENIQDIPHIEHDNKNNCEIIDSNSKNEALNNSKKFDKYLGYQEFNDDKNDFSESKDSFSATNREEQNLDSKENREFTNKDEKDSTFLENEKSPDKSVIENYRAKQIFYGNKQDELNNKTSEKIDGSFTSNVKKDGNSNIFDDSDLISRQRKILQQVSSQNNESNASLNKNDKIEPPINRKYFRPPLELLDTYLVPQDAKKENHEERIQRITEMLDNFHINVEPLGYIQGPSITRYEIKMPAGITVKKILGYDDDLKMCLLSKDDVRIEAPIPGKNAVGIEVANEHKVTVGLKEVLEGATKKKSKPGSLIFALGKDLVGNSITDDLAECKHFLVAGSTGSGKSVCMNVMLISLIMRYSPEELRLILIDPKGVEFKPYEHIPHLMIDEIIADPKRALAVFHWAYEEMEKRYKMFQEHDGVVDIDGYNEIVANDKIPKMPRIAIFVDELSNLMETCKKEMDARILSIAQKARAAGIHLILATQRPSVDVITGTIKANLPSRIALKLMTFADSNTIISEGGAEKLLGNGDMLYRNSGMSTCARYQGAFISRKEVNSIVTYIKENNQAYFDGEMVEYLNNAIKPKEEEHFDNSGELIDKSDTENFELFKKALWLAVNSGSVAISQLQRRFQIGFSRAGGLVDKMERMGYISGNEGSKARKVNMTVSEFEEKYGPVDDSY